MSVKVSIRTGLLCACGLTAMALAGFAVHRLLPEVAYLLVLWVMLSVPLGIAVGHCALKER